MTEEFRNFKGFAIDESNPNEMRIKGYFSVFNSESNPIPTPHGDSFTEIVAPEAFNTSLSGSRDIRALAFHDHNMVLGRRKNNTLALKSDDHGLYVEVTLPNTQYAKDLYTSIKDGYVDEASFGFRTRKDKWEKRNGKVYRTLLDVDLFEVSVVSEGAYSATAVSARDMEAFEKEINSLNETELTETNAVESTDSVSEARQTETNLEIEKAKIELTILEND
jgi:hypothetical protein